MRFPLLAMLLLLAPCASAYADSGEFGGAWVAWLCPRGEQRDSGKCSNFVLELHQKDGRLCGAHFFATAGAERIDEGAAPSLIGEVADGKATVVTTSGRASPPLRLRVEMKIVNGVLQWQRLENPAGDYLLPMSTRLTRSRSKTLFAPLFEQELKAACTSAFTIAAEREAAKATSNQPEPAASTDKR